MSGAGHRAIAETVSYNKKNMIQYLVPVLKFLGIFISALLGATALIVDFKKDSKITPWGKKALIGIILSFILTATLQGLEIYQSTKATQIEELKTQNMLFQIQKTLHPIAPEKIRAEFTVEFPQHETKNSPFFNSIDSLVSLIKKDSKISLPKGTELYHALTFEDEEQEKEVQVPYSLVVYDNSPLFPKLENDTLVYRSFVHQGLDFEFYKKGNYADLDSLRNPDLRFSMMGGRTSIEFEFHEEIGDLNYEVRKEGILADVDDFKRMNSGTVESLLDLADAVVKVYLVDDDYLSDDKFADYSSKSEIGHLRFDIGNRQFFVSRFIKKGDWYGGDYLFRFPSDILKEDINFNKIQQLITPKR